MANVQQCTDTTTMGSSDASSAHQFWITSVSPTLQKQAVGGLVQQTAEMQQRDDWVRVWASITEFGASVAAYIYIYIYMCKFI
jgi:hypothetical protein